MNQESRMVLLPQAIVPHRRFSHKEYYRNLHSKQTEAAALTFCRSGLLPLLIFTVPRGDIPIRPKQEAWHPVRHSGHLLAKLIQGYLFPTLNDHLIVDMPANEAVRESFHGIHQKISADGLHDVLDELRTVGF